MHVCDRKSVLRGQTGRSYADMGRGKTSILLELLDLFFDGVGPGPTFDVICSLGSLVLEYIAVMRCKTVIGWARFPARVCAPGGTDDLPAVWGPLTRDSIGVYACRSSWRELQKGQARESALRDPRLARRLSGRCCWLVAVQPTGRARADSGQRHGAPAGRVAVRQHPARD